MGILPENVGDRATDKWKSSVVEMPQDENFLVAYSTFVNYFRVPAFQDCSACFAPPIGARAPTPTSVGGDADSYITWAGRLNQGVDGCTMASPLAGLDPDAEMEAPGNMHSSGGADAATDSIFHIAANPKSLIHCWRDFSFITCDRPVRKFDLLFPEPQEVYLRQMSFASPDTENSK